MNNDQLLTREDIKTLLEEVLTTRELHLMKPVEQQALFLAGKLSQENREIRERMELVLQENNEFRERFRALPMPPEEISRALTKKEEDISRLTEKNTELGKRLEISTECTKVSRESEKRLEIQVREHMALIGELEERIKGIFLEEARARAELETHWKDSMGELRAKLQEEEAAQAELKAEWVKTMAALKEAELPWWKKLFRGK